MEERINAYRGTGGVRIEDDQCLMDLGEPPVSVKQCDEIIEDDFVEEDDSGPKYHVGP